MRSGELSLLPYWVSTQESWSYTPYLGNTVDLALMAKAQVTTRGVCVSGGVQLLTGYMQHLGKQAQCLD